MTVENQIKIFGLLYQSKIPEGKLRHILIFEREPLLIIKCG